MRRSSLRPHSAPVPSRPFAVHRARRTPARPAVASLAAAALTLPVALTLPAQAADAAPSRVHLGGTLLSAIGCADDTRTDTQTGCAAAELTPVGNGVWSRTYPVPAGSYDVQVNADGTLVGDPAAHDAPVPLVLQHPARLTFTYEFRGNTLQITSPDTLGVTDTGDQALFDAAAAVVPDREVTYSVLVDRFEDGNPANNTGGLGDDPAVSGYRPGDLDYFQGGDIAGVTQRLDYIAGLGVDAIALSPIFAGDAVRTTAAGIETGYHGQWAEDLTTLDPHVGTVDDLRALTAAAHARGLEIHLEVPRGTSEAAAAQVKERFAPFGVDDVRRPETDASRFTDTITGWLLRDGASTLAEVLYGDQNGTTAALSTDGRIGTALAGTENPTGRIGLGLDVLLLSQERAVLRYGDEQGFDGTTTDGDPAHETMFGRFDTGSPLYQRVATLTQVRRDNPALGRPFLWTLQWATASGTTLAHTLDPATGRSYLVYFVNRDGDGAPAWMRTPGSAIVDHVYSAHDDVSSNEVRESDIYSYGGGAPQSGYTPVSLMEWPRSTLVYRDAEPITGTAWSAHPYLEATPREDARTVVGAQMLQPPGMTGLSRDYAVTSPVARVAGYAVRPLGADAWTPLGATVGAGDVVHDARTLPRGTVLEYRVVADGGQDGTSGASAIALAGVDLQGRGGDAVVLPGTGTDPAWSAQSADGATVLLHEPESGAYIRAGERRPETTRFLAVRGGDWSRVLGRDGTPSGAPYDRTHDGGQLIEVFDPAGDTVVDSARGLYTIAGSWNTAEGADRYGSEFYWGLRGDALDQVMADPDGDGRWTVALDVPAGTHQVKVAEDLRTEVITYQRGPGVEPRDPDAVSMEHPGGVVTFFYDAATGALTWQAGDHRGEPTQPAPEPTPEPTGALVALARGNVTTGPTTDVRVPVGADVLTGDWDGDGVDTLA